MARPVTAARPTSSQTRTTAAAAESLLSWQMQLLSVQPASQRSSLATQGGWMLEHGRGYSSVMIFGWDHLNTACETHQQLDAGVNHPYESSIGT
jgi:hypothetical protein